MNVNDLVYVKMRKDDMGKLIPTTGIVAQLVLAEVVEVRSATMFRVRTEDGKEFSVSSEHLCQNP